MLRQVAGLQRANAQQQSPGAHGGVHDEAQERIHQKKTIVLQQDQQRQRKPRMVHREFAFPHPAGRLRTEMDKGDREQEQAHGARQPLPRGAITGAQIHDDGDHRQRAESNGHEQQSGRMKARRARQQVGHVQADRDYAEHIARGPYGSLQSSERNVEQHGRQQAQRGETDRGDNVRCVVGSLAARERDQRSGVPQHRKTGGERRQDAALLARSPPTDDKEVKEDAENQHSGAVADGVDQDGTVN